MSNEYLAATDKIPIATYEDPDLRFLTLACLSVTLSNLYTAAIYFGEYPGLWLHALSGFIYVAGSIADRHTSAKNIYLTDNAVVSELNISVEEQSPMLPDDLSVDDLYTHPKKYFDGVVSALSVLLPPVGITVGVGRGLGALNNHRLSRRICLAVEIAQE